MSPTNSSTTSRTEADEVASATLRESLGSARASLVEPGSTPDSLQLEPEIKPSVEPERPVVEAGEQAPSPEVEVVTPAEKTEATPLPTTTVSPTATPATTTAPPAVGELQKQVESILSENLADYYVRLTPEQKAVFKKKGEETASQITLLLQKTHVKIKKIWRLIRRWLALLPGVNKFFLEQEAKIKTDRLLFLSQQEKNKEKN